MGLSIEKIEKEAPKLMTLVKQAVDTIDKSKLNGQKAKVVLCLDFSISMEGLYRDGSMQRFSEKILALATQFDDDGNIDFFVFDTGAAYLGEFGIADFEGSIGRLTKGRRKGSTNYADVMLMIRDHFGFGKPAPAKKGLFGKLKKVAPSTTEPANEPVYVLFLTDGVPNSEADAVAAITEVSTAPIFWKFLSIGPSKIAFLQKLDDLPSRFVDNADYKHISDVNAVSDAKLFEDLLDEFPEWIETVRSSGLIK